ncbi:hypothetical protein FIBSPDRAFT_481110 [Athelia psychrophila]|uniref:Uncharacterized protein n=1 Tax=Athelia psychrophila TaxID=1759441 RepID=A0A166VFG2_9AGAM|nr:hypothetical protein FIBSPDRAFT_481110 [Fibularhizoctonia sp. CBS 109695]
MHRPLAVTKSSLSRYTPHRDPASRTPISAKAVEHIRVTCPHRLTEHRRLCMMYPLSIRKVYIPGTTLVTLQICVRLPFSLPPIPTDQKSPLMILMIHLSLRLRSQITIRLPRFNSNIPVFQYLRPTITLLMLGPKKSQPAEFKGPTTD